MKVKLASPQKYRRNYYLIENKLPHVLVFHLLENRQATLLEAPVLQCALRHLNQNLWLFINLSRSLSMAMKKR